MALTTATKVRALANWPVAVTDAQLAPHLGGAARELSRRLGATVYGELVEAEATDELRLAGEEIEGCLAIALAIPALHVFSVAEGPTIPKQIEDTEFSYLDPEQAERQAAIWRARAERALAETDFTGESDPGPSPRMYAV
jgi:hypothetical protein